MNGTLGHPKNSANEGFTIVELLIVVVVIAILAAITIVAYNGITSHASDSTAKSDLETTIKKLELDKISNQLYPLTLAEASGGGIKAGSDIRLEYSSNGNTYCITASSVIAKTDYYQNNGGATASGKCANHLGYAGGAGIFSASSIFGASPPTGTYQTYNDGGGSLWVGNRFYTNRPNGVRIVGARVWESTDGPTAFTNLPVSVQLYTQDWQGSNLGGWNNLGTPVATATYSGTRTPGTWTYIWFPTPVTLPTVTPAANGNDMATIAVKYDGNYYVAPNPPVNSGVYVQSNEVNGVYLAEDPNVGRAVSNVYPTTSGQYYYGIDMIFTPL